MWRASCHFHVKNPILRRKCTLANFQGVKQPNPNQGQTSSNMNDWGTHLVHVGVEVRFYSALKKF